VRLRKLKANPFDEVTKLKTEVEAHYVEDHELNLAMEIGRELGGPQHIVALALMTAYLCSRRSVEVRAFTRPQITEAGIEWIGAKRQKGKALQRGLIEWSPRLRAIIDEALAIERGDLAGVWYIFGNMRGGKYTKGGWKKTLSVLMEECEIKAAERGIEFRKFSLQDCRPKGLTDKLEDGHTDVVDAALHTSEKMVRQVYDRRRIKVAKATK
jgi:integrase